MSDTVLAQVMRLKQYARMSRDGASKNPARLEAARKDLVSAVKLLEDAQKHTNNEEYKRALARELADCYGMLGGIYRRKAEQEGSESNLKDAATMYERGLQSEADDSYNLSNSLVISILLDPSSLEEKQIEIKDAISKVQTQIRGQRRDQWWAWADLGLFNLLIGDIFAAQDAYKQFISLGARSSDCKSVIAVLRNLYAVLSTVGSPFAQSVAQSMEDAILFLSRKL